MQPSDSQSYQPGVVEGVTLHLCDAVPGQLSTVGEEATLGRKRAGLNTTGADVFFITKNRGSNGCSILYNIFSIREDRIHPLFYPYDSIRNSVKDQHFSKEDVKLMSRDLSGRIFHPINPAVCRGRAGESRLQEGTEDVEQAQRSRLRGPLTSHRWSTCRDP